MEKFNPIFVCDWFDLQNKIFIWYFIKFYTNEYTSINF
jgi:hypothetical protein